MRADIEAALESGTAAVRTLDVIIANQLHDDPETVAVWERDRRVDYPHRGRTATPPISAPAPSAAPGPHFRPGSVEVRVAGPEFNNS